MNFKQQARLVALTALGAALLLTGFEPLRPPAQESGEGWAVLTVPDTHFEDHFAYTAAIHGDVVAAGAPGTRLPGAGERAPDQELSPGALAGAVYVFQRQGEAWSEGEKLLAADAQPGDQFGFRLALSGDTLAASAPYKHTSPGGNAAGAVYLFRRQAGAWTQQARLTAPDGAPFDLFGSALALHGDTLAVGARSADQAGARNAGAVYVFQRRGADWTLQAKLAASSPAELDYFGQDLALLEDGLLVGAPGRDEGAGDNAGAVYFFQRRGDAWSQAARLTPPGPAQNAQFGYSLGLDERSGTLAVFAQQSQPYTPEAQDAQYFSPEEIYLGTVHVFEHRGADWVYQAHLAPEQLQFFGYYFLPRNKVIAGESALTGPVVVLSMGFYGNYIYREQGDDWTSASLPVEIFQAQGLHSMTNLLAVDEDLLVFGSISLGNGGGGVLLVETEVLR